MSTSPSGHSVNSTAAGRVLNGVLGFFIVPLLYARDGLKHATRWVWRAPWFVKAVLGLILVGGFAGGTVVLILRAGGRDQESINAEWRRFEATARTASPKELLAILDDILKKDPTNRDALSRKSAIESGEADPADRAMVALSIRIHLKFNRHADAVREAKKMYEIDPRDWMTNCILGQEAIVRKDQPAIDKYLAAVVDPTQAGSAPDLGGLLYALELYRQTGKDASILRTFTVNKVIPSLKNENLATMPTAGRVQILACYIDTCLSVSDAACQNILQFWAWSSRLADGILDDAKDKADAQVLTQLGILQPPLGGAISRFHKLDLMGESEAKRQMKMVEDRARKIWLVTREVDPKNPAGYVGEAYALLRGGDTEGALKMLEAGSAAAGTSLQLLSAYTAWAKAAKMSDKILPYLLEAANKFPDNVTLWHLVAEAAEASNRRDRAIEAIQKSRALDPENPWFTWVEARLWLDADMAEKALELLKTLPEKERLRNPVVARAYVRALVGAGEEKLVPEFARNALSGGQKSNDATLALAPALGLLDSPPTLSRAILADDLTDRVRAQWNSSLEAVQAQAKARLWIAEQDVPRWSEVRVRAATDALDRLRTRAPADLWAPAMLAWVRLKGGQSPELAWNEIAPVVRAEYNPDLSADVLEALGTVYFAREQYDDAIRVLKRAVASARQPAGPLIALALAYLQKKDTRAARETFQRASNFTMSDRVRDEYKNAAPKFPKE